MMRRVRVWRYDPANDVRPGNAEPGDLDDRRVVLLAASERESNAVAWMAVDAYDAEEATLLFAAPPGKEYAGYVAALLASAVEEARGLGFGSLLAHWRAGWSEALSVLSDHGFTEAAPGLWRRIL